MHQKLNELDPNNRAKNMLLKVASFIKKVNKEPEAESQILIDIEKYHSIKDNRVFKEGKKVEVPVEKLFLSYIKGKSEEESFDIPTFPNIILKLNDAVSNPNSDFHVFSEVIKLDPSITLKILKLANSSFYNKKGRDIVNLEEAVGLLGLQATKNLILSVVMSNSLFRNNYSKRIAKKIFREALFTAIIAENFAKIQKLNESFLYTLALLHNIGAIVALNVAETFMKDQGIYLKENELMVRIINKFKLQLTKAVLKKWKFNDLYIEAVLNQDKVKQANDNKLSKILYFSQTVSKSLLSGGLKGLGKEDLTVFYEEVLKNAKLDVYPRTARILMNESIREFETMSKFIS